MPLQELRERLRLDTDDFDVLASGWGGVMIMDGLARIAGRERDITELVGLCKAARLKVRVVLDR